MFNHTDAEVPVFHRGGKIALLEGCPHRLALTLRHPAAVDEKLGPPAHRGVQRPNQNVVVAGLTQGNGPDLPAAGGFEPESLIHPDILCVFTV
jgi:hypothetical protein